MLNFKRKVLEDCERNVNASATIYNGRPVYLNSNGEVVNAVNTNLVYGLSQGDKNIYRDDTYGEFAAFGSGKMGVAKKGIVTVEPSVYDTVSGATTIYPYNENLTYAIQDKLYADSNGLISNAAVQKFDADSSVDGVSQYICVNFLGRVVKAPSATDTKMDIELMC